MGSTRRQFVAGVAATTFIPTAASAAAGGTVTPEMFGAKGDGTTNDTRAFAAMSAHMNARGGGTIVLRPVTYLVGLQHPSFGRDRVSFAPSDIIHLKQCTGPIVINGNGASLRAAPGLRYGRFDPNSGQALPDPPRRDLANQATPYEAMIYIHGCSGGISIADLELDGGLQRMRIGGRSAKHIWPAAGSGIRLRNNSGPERLARIKSHHHPVDGIMLSPASARTGSTIVTDVVCDYNARQGCSITGGRDLVFQRCKFRHTGRAVFHNAPGHGVDIEAEGRPIRNVLFEDCEFSDNVAIGMGAGRGTDSDDIRFSRCKFIGTTNWSLGPQRSRMRFRNCLIVGTFGYVYGDLNPDLAPQFFDCLFTDDPKLSPTGRVFLGKGGPKSIAIIRKNPNVLFSRCKFRLVGEGLLPISTGVIYDSCEMSQRSPAVSKPGGTYIGTSSISGNANLDGSIIRGKVVLNGRTLARTT
jgi:hypothetical protein